MSSVVPSKKMCDICMNLKDHSIWLYFPTCEHEFHYICAGFKSENCPLCLPTIDGKPLKKGTIAEDKTPCCCQLFP